MKRILTLLAIATFASCSLFAQDDMYFTPKTKAVKDKEKAEARAAIEKQLAEERAAEAKRQAKLDSISLEAKKEWFRKNRHRISQTEDGKLVYHRGRDCSDDEYNRRGKFASSYTVVSDSVGNDIIEFTPGNGQYPDSLIASIDTLSGSVKKKSSDYYDDDDEYYYSRHMNRFDGFYGSSRYWLLYNNPWYSHWAYDPFFWSDPWYWNSSWVYSPWYWNDPWYWHDPWYYGYYGGYYGGYWGTSYIPLRHHYNTPVVFVNNGHRPHHRPHGTRPNNQGYRNFSSDVKTISRLDSNGNLHGSRGNFGGYRGNRSSTSSEGVNYGNARGYSEPSDYNRGNFGGSRSNSGYSNSSSSSSRSTNNDSSRSSSSSSSGSRGGNFGGSRSNSSYSNSSSSSSSSRSYSSPSSSSSSSSSRGSFGGSRSSGGSSGGGGGRFGGRR